jgi:hypothetical protein
MTHHRQQAQNPALASIIRDRRVQVLPIQWRASLQIEQDNNEEDVVHGMDNRFTMAGQSAGRAEAGRADSEMGKTN